MSAIELSRTAALGGHTKACTDCGLVRCAYSSCRNRHGPKCPGAACTKWLAARHADLLPVEDFLVVFTPPPAAAEIAFQKGVKRQQREKLPSAKSAQVSFRR